ncbi:ATP-binding protein [Leeia aquatica]|uniref:histidine kinase n=1 Tax=Leeia aquatica TaxID=2725557 RepID=A0A847S4R8_9NEIS|nr:ATP-binding protein [Leeia aquatica]NLR74794.1 GAF domain-containing protein [Leeia aquatica]
MSAECVLFAPHPARHALIRSYWPDSLAAPCTLSLLPEAPLPACLLYDLHDSPMADLQRLLDWRQHHPDVPLILLGADLQHEAVLRLLQGGAGDILQDPLLPALPHYLHRILQQAQLDAAIDTLLLETAGLQGADFLQALVEALARLLQVDQAYASTHDPVQPDWLCTVAGWRRGQPVPPVRYPLSGSPCEQVLRQGKLCCYPNDVQTCFPEDLMLQEDGLVGYIGYPLRDRQGQVIGLVNVLHQHPLHPSAQLRTILRLFAARAGTELERLRTADQLQDTQGLLQHVYAHAPILLCQLDPAGHVQQANPALEQALGSALPFLHGQPWHVLFQQPAIADWQQPPQQLETSLPAASGKQTYSWVFAPRCTAEGSIRDILAIGTDMTQRKQNEQALRDKATALEATNRELEDFAFVASHDLQEPLRKILAYSDLLQQECAAYLPDTGQQYLQLMNKATQRLQQLIRDLLQLSRVTRSQRRFEAVSLTDVLEQVQQDLEIPLRDTQARLQIEGSLPTLTGDPVQLQQVFLNLLSNALKYTRPDVPPEIRIHAEPYRLPHRKPQWRILICDNGIGFEQQYAERIFKVFQRLHGREQYEGTGIGLAICKKIVERHRGQITAEGRPGAGATFILDLPA